MKFPRSERDARAKSIRKLNAIERHARKHLYDIASFWDEGRVTGTIDLFLDDLDTRIKDVRDQMDEEIQVHEEQEAEYA